LENARAGNPILCFDKATGCTEYVDESCGRVSPYLDVDNMAAAVVEFAADSMRREEAGRIIRRRVAGYTVDHVVPRILDLVTDVIGPPEPTR
jgi:glycosyltransferase involved in cell wall biosynthesis